MIQCSQCHTVLPPEHDAEPCPPCPSCGSTTRFRTMTCETGHYLHIGQDVKLVHVRPGLQSKAEADDQGNITLVADGPSPKNEEGADVICVRLVRALNAAGGTWLEPTPGHQHGDTDRRSVNAAGDDQMNMQVVRPSNSGLWREVNRSGSATLEYDAATVARELIDAVIKKAGKYPAVQKRALTLVLDAARTPSHTFGRVLDVFRAEHLAACQAAGFAQVWLVGPSDPLVVRLDT